MRMSDALPKLFLHLSTTAYAKEGYAHLLVAPKDYLRMQTFLAKHFTTLKYDHDESGFPTELYETPAGSMFLIDDKGEFIREPK